MMWIITRAFGIGFGCACSWLIAWVQALDITDAAAIYLLIWVGLADGRATPLWRRVE